MNIHEYQAKELLKRHGVAVPDGYVAWTAGRGGRGGRKLPGPVYVVKSQIHAGGRGAGRFADDPNGKGGVRLARSIEEVRAAADAMLGHMLVTKQTGPAGRAGASRLCRGRLRHRPRTLFLAAGRSRQRARHHGRFHRRRHGDRGSRGPPTGEDPARRDRSRDRSLRPSTCAGWRSRWASPASRSPRSAASCRGCTHLHRASIARSSRSTRWWSPKPARWSRWMPRSASTTTRCSAIRNWRSCATRRRKTRRNWRPRSTT